MIENIRSSYEGLLKENESLRERLKRLKAQHDKETHVMKQA